MWQDCADAGDVDSGVSSWLGFIETRPQLLVTGQILPESAKSEGSMGHDKASVWPELASNAAP